MRDEGKTDQVVFHDGFNMQFRAGETTSGCGTELLCPNQFCPKAGQAAVSDPRQTAEVEALLGRREAERQTTVGEPVAVSASECVVGPIAYGFDRPGGGGALSVSLCRSLSLSVSLWLSLSLLQNLVFHCSCCRGIR